MPRFHIAAVLLCLSALVVPHQASVKGGKGGNKCGKADASKLGNPSLNRYDASYDLEVSPGKVDCDYTFAFTFKHDEDLPVPDTAEQCNPTSLPPALASDGIPYLASRSGYESMPKDIQEATGIDHLSLDFNPCGHPPVGVFNIPHYDMHVYLISPEDRMCMTCAKIPGTPVCRPPSPSAGPNTMAGNGFFNIAKLRDETGTGRLSNMPSNFDFSDGDAIPYMGMHAWDFSKQPKSTSWDSPVWVMGSYDGKIVNYEPMFPLDNVVGNDSFSFTESLTYEGQSMPQLPTSYRLDYSAVTGYTTVTFKGKSLKCNKRKKN